MVTLPGVSRVAGYASLNDVCVQHVWGLGVSVWD